MEEILLQLNIDIYHDLSNYSILDRFEKKSLYCILVKLNTLNILCIRGTEDWGDRRNDIAMFRKHIPEQYYHIEPFFKKCVNKYRDIIITGHSLGGSICQMLSLNYGVPSINFAPFGIQDILCGDSKVVTNYGMESDWIFTINIDKQVGKTFIIPNTKSIIKFVQNGEINYSLLGSKSIRLNNFGSGHLLEDFGSLNSGILVDKVKLKIKSLCKGGILQH